MYPIFVSTHPPAALCLEACSQPRTFSCFQISLSPAPPSPACAQPSLPAARWQAGGWEQPRALRRLPAGQEIASSVNAANCNAAKLVLVGRLLPKFLVGRYTLLCNKDGESKLLLSRCFPVCSTPMGEREEGKNNCSVPFEKGCLQRPEQGGRVAVPLSLARTGDTGH